MSTISDIFGKVVSDAEYRKKFCDNPKAVFEEEGVELPEGMDILENIDPAELDDRINKISISNNDENRLNLLKTFSHFDKDVIKTDLNVAGIHVHL